MIGSLIFICTINVWIPVVDDKNNNKVLFRIQAQDTLEGKMLSLNTEKYLLDFSVDASLKGYDGDYSKIFVRKENCVRK